METVRLYGRDFNKEEFWLVTQTLKVRPSRALFDLHWRNHQAIKKKVIIMMADPSLTQGAYQVWLDLRKKLGIHPRKVRITRAPSKPQSTP